MKSVILGIACYYHDSSACLIVDGTIVAAAMEERFTRIKHDNSFPVHAIRWCLSWAMIDIREVTEVAFYEKPVVKFERILAQHLSTFPKSMGVYRESISQWFSFRLSLSRTLKIQCGYSGPVSFVPHHMSHAAGAYYLSGYKKCVIMTVDGVGEWSTTTLGMGEFGKISIDREIRFPHSVGLVYSALTAFLGFGVNDAEYKVMGLAAYGDPAPYSSHMDELISVYADGSYAVNIKYFSYVYADHMFTKDLEKLFGVPPRRPGSAMTRPYENIASALQKKLESVLFHIIRHAYDTYKNKNLCLSGGVALNSVANAKILSTTSFKNIYIPPDPGDGGGSMGAALYAYWRDKNPVYHPNFTPYIGPSYDDLHIQSVLDAYGFSYEKYPSDEKLIDSVALLLHTEKIIGWFQGRMEWGPRALGNRSILASGQNDRMKDIINAKVKHREMFRPFAPSILEEYVTKYFTVDMPIPESARFMLFVYPFTKKGKSGVPATVHVDGTGRLQVVRRADNPLYYDLIDAYRKLTGVPAIINTSFNVRGEPIVCTPRDAINCFIKTDIDYLVMGHYIIDKSKITNPKSQ